MAYSLKSVDQDTIDQYVDGKTLLSATLTERADLLRKLEQLAQAPQGQTSSEHVAGFPLVHAQTLLYELSVIAEYIDLLIFEINNYATRCGEPHVQVINVEIQ